MIILSDIFEEHDIAAGSLDWQLHKCLTLLSQQLSRLRLAAGYVSDIWDEPHDVRVASN